MPVIELRKRIIDKLSSIEDEVILKEIYDLVKIEAELDIVYKLTEDEKKAIDAGLRDVQDDRIVSSDEANALIRGWLRK